MCLYACVAQVSESKAFKEFLRLVLSVGNILNATSKQQKKSGGAYGFHLKSLSKLQDTKSINPGTKITMLQCLCKIAIEKLKKPELVNYEESWSSVCDTDHHANTMSPNITMIPTNHLL